MREGTVASIMCSYNAVNGVPSCANDLIQNKVARDQWGFQGFIVRRTWLVCNEIHTVHRSAIVEPSVTYKAPTCKNL